MALGLSPGKVRLQSPYSPRAFPNLFPGPLPSPSRLGIYPQALAAQKTPPDSTKSPYPLSWAMPITLIFISSVFSSKTLFALPCFNSRPDKFIND